MVERVLGLLLLPVLTRELSAAEYGIWAQTVVVSGVLMPLVVFGLPAAIVKFFSAGVAADIRRRWMGRTVVFAGAIFAGFALLAWAAPRSVAIAVYGSDEPSAFVPVLVTLLAADALLDLLIAYLRAAFRMRWIALAMLTRGVLRFGFLLLALRGLEMSFIEAFAVMALLQLALAGIGFVLEWRRRAPEPAPTLAAGDVSWRALLAFAAPLVLVSVLTSVNGFADRFVLTHLLGLDTLAVYAAVNSLVAITSVAYTVLGFTLFPVLSRMWAQGDSAGAARLAADTVRVFLFIALPYALWLASVIESLLPLMTTQAYRVSAEVALLLGVAAVGYGLYQIMLYLLLLAGRGMQAAGLMLAAALLNAVLNLLLVPRFGLIGAASAAAISNGALASAAYLSAKARFPWASAARIGAGAVLAAMAAVAIDRAAPGQWGGVAASLLLATLICAATDWFAGRSVLRQLVWRKAAS